MLGIGHHKYYERAKPRSMQRHSSQQWESAVGGTRNSVLAIYGSTDKAVKDHKNSTLCVVVPDGTGHVLKYSTADIRNDTDHFTQWTAELLIQRAIQRGMSIVEYAAMVGVTL